MLKTNCIRCHKTTKRGSLVGRFEGRRIHAELYEHGLYVTHSYRKYWYCLPCVQMDGGFRWLMAQLTKEKAPCHPKTAHR